jgi:hypothetical protein
MAQLYIQTPVSRAANSYDFDKVLICTAALNITIRNDRLMGLNADNSTVIALYQQSAGAVAFVADSDVTFTNTAPTQAQYGTVGIMHVGPNTWAYIKAA